MFEAFLTVSNKHGTLKRFTLVKIKDMSGNLLYGKSKQQGSIVREVNFERVDKNGKLIKPIIMR